MRLEGEARKQRAIECDENDDPALRELNCDVLVKSIGYRSLKMTGVPFDNRKNVIPHEFGCVIDPDSGKLEVGLYVAGWIKRGPVGIVDATLRDSMETFKMLKHHMESDMLEGRSTSIAETKELFKKPSENDFRVVEKDNWQKIKDEEISRGEKLGKIKEKIINRTEMFSVASM